MPKFLESELELYFKELNCGSTMIARFKKIISDYTRLTNKDPEFIFVEDEKNDDGNREFLTVVMLTNDFYAEGKVGGKSNEFYISTLKKSVWHVIFTERRNLDDDVATPKSVISVNVNFHHGGFASFDATGKNCEQVITAVKEYFLPNMC